MRIRNPFTRTLLLSGVTVFGIACGERWPHEPFTPEAWKACSWEQRYVLYESLAESGLLDGASRDRVVELLGVPDGKNKPDNLAYLVRKRPLGFLNWHDVRVLDIRLDKDGHVREYFIRGT
jgi:hypothetical protein